MNEQKNPTDQSQNKNKSNTKIQLFSSFVKSKEFVFMIVIGIIMVIVWIGMSVFSSFQKTSISPEIQKQTEALSPIIDKKTIQSLKTRKLFTQSDLENFTISIEESKETVGDIVKRVVTGQSTTKSASASAQPNQ